ncbi:DsbA family oxidoreductase [Nocardioides sp.]|uniref:DsbA family oxidoreductase n=1 Tax=Nocardioides sp. TaxID=35761 RepID=UPI0035182AEE
MRVEIWSDVVCPWCYLGKRRLEEALAGFEHRDEVEVVYRSFELDPAAPAHGHGDREPTLVALTRKYGRSESQMRAMMQQLIATAAEEGLAFRLLETVHTSTRDAHRLLHLAREVGGPALQYRLKEALFAAYFTRAQDVADPAVLAAVAAEVGLDADRVAQVLAGQEYAAQVQADIDAAHELGVGGVPFTVVDGRYGISGAQPAEAIGQVLERAWSERPAVTVVAAGGAGGDACGPDGCPI